MKNFTADHTNTTIYISKKLNDALEHFEPWAKAEFENIKDFFPDYTIAVRSITKKEDKKTANKNLTYPAMVRYMVSQPDGLENLVEFAKIRNLSDQKGHSYKAVKDWFLSVYPAFLVSGVSEKEREHAERFISLEKARAILKEFSDCETLEDVRDVVSTYFDTDVSADNENITAMNQEKKAS